MKANWMMRMSCSVFNSVIETIVYFCAVKHGRQRRQSGRYWDCEYNYSRLICRVFKFPGSPFEYFMCVPSCGYTSDWRCDQSTRWTLQRRNRAINLAAGGVASVSNVWNVGVLVTNYWTKLAPRVYLTVSFTLQINILCSTRILSAHS